MTVSNQTSKIVYTGDGSTDTFPYPFKIYADTDLVVTKVQISDGAETILSLTTDYTVTGAGADEGGSVVLAQVDDGNGGLVDGSIPATHQLVIQRVLDYVQGLDYTTSDPFPAETHERGLDYLTMLIQQVQEQVNRGVIQSVTSSVPVVIPPPEALHGLRWNAAGTALENGMDPEAAYDGAVVAQEAAEAAQAAAEVAQAAAEGAQSGAGAAQIAAEAARDAAQAAQGGAEIAAASIGSSVDSAAASATAALNSRNEAGAFATLAEGHKDDAAASAAAALASEQAAATSESNAAGSESAAQTAQNLAEAAQGQAEIAQAAAEAAQAAAEAAAGSLTLASQAEAEAGTENTKYMSALRVAQAIAELSPDVSSDVETLEDNLALLAFRQAADASISVMKMEDGIVDRFIDQTGVDDANSVALYDGVENKYSNQAGDQTGSGTALSSGAYEQAIAHFKLDGNRNDSSGNGKTLNYYGTSETYETGKVGGASGALEIERSRSVYVSVPDSDNIIDSQADFAIVLGVKIESYTQDQIFYGKRPASGAPTDGLYVYQNASGQVTVSFVSRTSIVTTDCTLNDGNWHQLILVKTGTTAELFVNGVSKGTTTVGATMPNTSNALEFGSYGNSSANFDGAFDEIYIYHKALSSSEVSAHWTKFNAGLETSLLDASNAFDNSNSTYWGSSAVSTTAALLLHLDNDYTDESGNTVTAVGSPSFDSSVKKFGTHSIHFTGTHYLTVPDSDLWNFGTGDFMISFQWRRVGNLQSCLFEIGNGASDGIRFWWTSTSLEIKINNSTVVTGTIPSADGNFHHIELSRVGSSVYLFIDGTQSGSTGTSSASITSGTNGVAIGAGTSGASIVPECYFDEIIIQKGVGGHTSNFTAPTSAYTTDGVSGTAYIGYDFGSGVAKAITGFTIKQHASNQAINSVKVQRSDNGTDWTDVSTVSIAADTVKNTYSFTNTTAARYWRLLANANPTSGSWEVEEIELTLVSNLDLRSEAFTAEAVPTEARVVVLEEDIDAVTVNTDLELYVSRDGGTTYTKVTLADEGDFDTTKRILSGSVSISSQPSGSSMKWKALGANLKRLSLYGVSLAWK